MSAKQKGAGGKKTHGDGEEALVGMEEAIRLLKTSRPTFYRWLRTGKIRGMKVGRQWRFYRGDIDRFLKGEAPRIELPVDIAPLVDVLRKQMGWKPGAPQVPAGLNPVQQCVNTMIALGAKMAASDIHITTHRRVAENVTILRYRVGGVLQQVAEIDTRLLPAVIEEWKRLAACNVNETKRPQEGRIGIVPSGRKEMGIEKALDLRVSFLPAALGESMTARILNPEVVMLDLEHLPYSPGDHERIRRAIRLPAGLVVVTGPTGCGKTTTLYACLKEIARSEVKVMTVEDPVEYLLPWATQVAVNSDCGVTFSAALRSLLRSDPDIILVGEIRDLQTAMVVMQAALTGHMVLTTLHTPDAVGALTRMVDMGIDPFLIADTTKLVIAQRLLRKVCRHCCIEESPAADRLDMASELARRGGVDLLTVEQQFNGVVGCAKCAKTGYRGRTVSAETLEVTTEIATALRNGASAEDLTSIAVGQGMTTMAADGVRRAAAGETALEEVLRVLA